MNNYDSLIKKGCVFTALAAIGYAFYISCKADSVIKKYNTAIENASNELGLTKDDISDELKTQAVQDAVEKVANNVTRSLSYDIKREAKNLVNDHVEHLVKEESEPIKRDIRKKLEREIDSINLEDIKDDIISKAACDAETKFENELDGIIQKHTDKLEEMTRVYTSIADMMTNHMSSN